MPSLILQVALPILVDNHFDYLPPTDVKIEHLSRGCRVRVPFGQRVLIGMILALENESQVAEENLKSALAILDETPILSEEMLNLLIWASHYYHYAIGQVIFSALPSLLRKGEPAHLDAPPNCDWILTTEGQFVDIEKLPKNQERNAIVLSLLRQNMAGLNESEFVIELSNPRMTLQALQKKGWITPRKITSTSSTVPISPVLSLNIAQAQAVSQVSTHLDKFYPCLLYGVTGSGKTEVYLQIIQTVLEKNCQTLLLVPEINLTPQMVGRFKRRFNLPIAVLHSKLNDKERLYAWLSAKEGSAPIIIGTRSAIWIPLARPGLFIVDEEHDLSYKEQDLAMRYSARDIAVIRAQRAKVPIILGSATPSLDSLYNVKKQRYHFLSLPERAGEARQPHFHVVDMRQQPNRSLSQQLKNAIKHCLDKKQQVLLFINRRGYAPTLTCFQCGWVAKCEQCDARLTYHETDQRLLCHHCGAVRRVDNRCPDCQHNELNLLGRGTERLEEEITQYFHQARILRIDSDSTRGKHAMHHLLKQIQSGEVDILIGTQMLAKGHHFPKVTLVGVMNIDGGLFGADFRASERVAQLLTQVAGRAGRAEDAGQVIIQTYHPTHPLLECLIQQGYSAFSEIALKEREETQFPPYTRLALLRAEAADAEQAMQFLHTAKEQAKCFNTQKVELWGPVTAPMEKRAGWYRAQLLLQSTHRENLHTLLNQWLPTLKPPNSKVRWSLDVDPQSTL